MGLRTHLMSMKIKAVSIHTARLTHGVPNYRSRSGWRRVGEALCFGLLASTLAVRATEPTKQPSREPVLRIEAGMHTGTISRLAVDTSGRLVLTASADKTARLWELPSGRLLRVLRPPIGTGEEGKLFTGALTPDGTLAAVAGTTGAEWDYTTSVYLFDTASGRLLRRIEGLDNSILQIAFSGSGRYLAGLFPEGRGLRVWDVATGRELARDLDYSHGDSYGVDWHGDDRLVTACDDGNLRLYQFTDGRLQRTARQPVSKHQPYSAHFSPDGRRIAVGFLNSPDVMIMSGGDLSFLSNANTTGIKDVLNSITWARDGNGLAAGGRWFSKGGYAIRHWEQANLEKMQDTTVTANTIMDLQALPDGGILFGAGDPAWGVLSATGQRTLLGASPLADYRDVGENFRVSADGTVVTFGFQHWGKSPTRFSLNSRRLEPMAGNAGTENLFSPRIEGLKITDWRAVPVPKLNGRALYRDPYEMPLSLAIARNATSFLLGTEWHVHSFTAKGALRWTIPAPSPAVAVNLTAGDQLAVAAYGDGTIRWHRADNGQELLAFFPHADRRRWILWTPQGYYDCSPGGEDLIGWHLNRCKEQGADFFSAARFRNIYYRPDVVKRVLQTRDPALALREANRELGRPGAPAQQIREIVTRLAPPVVEIETGGVFAAVALPDEATQVRVRYLVRQTGAEATTKVSVRFNGRLVDMKTPPPTTDGVAEVMVPLPAGMPGELSLFAEHRLTIGEPAVLRIERQPGKVRPRRPNLYVVAVGVADLKMNDAADLNHDGKATMDEIERSGLFKEGELVLPDLEHAGDDARQIAEAFNAQKARLYERVETKLLLDKTATAPAIREALRSIAKQAGPEDVAVFFFSGHGVVDDKAGFYLATYEANPKNPAATALPGTELANLLEGIKARTVLALDTCHSGGAFGGTRFTKVITSSQDLTGLVNQLSSAEQGTVVFSSSAASEQSLEDPRKGGVFTQAMCDGLAGSAGSAEPVTCVGMQAWLTRRVPELVAALVNGATDAPQQTPACVIPKGVPDFPLAKP